MTVHIIRALSPFSKESASVDVQYVLGLWWVSPSFIVYYCLISVMQIMECLGHKSFSNFSDGKYKWYTFHHPVIILLISPTLQQSFKPNSLKRGGYGSYCLK